MNELDPELYRVALIAPLEIEARAALLLLDHQHKGRFPVSRGDDYVFQAGDACGHNVIIATLPAGQEYGTGSAAALASQVKKCFPNLWFGLLVGVAAGLPNLSRNPQLDIRLGDVLVGLPEGESAGLIAYDLGKETGTDGFQLLRCGHVLANTEPIVRSAIGSIKLQAPDDADVLLEHYKHIRDKRHANGTFLDPGQENDILFWMDESGMSHAIDRRRRPDSERTRVWYGAIGSGEKLMKNAQKRNELRDKYNIIGLEMEAAGTMNRIPVGVIRGVCDYGDEYKNKEWQPYAAAMAASYAKAILAEIPPANATRKDESTSQNSNGSKRRLSEQSLCLRDGRPKRCRHDDIENQQAQSPSNSPQVVSRSLNEEQRRGLLDSLGFEQIDARHDTIKRAHGKTCAWLLKKPEYLDWLDPSKFAEHHGFLWIKGKPGAGKSTLMKFIVNYTRKKHDGKIVSFFFNARGEDLEKSTIGMYRSLLLQLLEKLPHLQNVLDSLGSETRNSACPQWSIESLKTLFEQAILNLGKLKVMCFIDALDECEELQIRDMVSLFESLGGLAVSHDITFHVCFSSRHYPYITISKGLDLILEGQEGHEQDIVSYLDSELKIGHTKLAEEIRLNVKEKASGVFMWVVLVVGILQLEYDRGHMHALRKRLQDIPSDLHRLFREILTRDNQHKSELILVIQWVLFARLPLQPNQLYIAVLYGIDPEAASTWDLNEIEERDIQRYILNSSKGLVEITRSKKNPTVQFIHESVRDFLLKENGLEEIWFDAGGNFQGVSHDRLKQCCLGYMSLGISALENRILLPKTLSHEVKEARDFAANKFPLLEYTIKNVLYHADAAEASGVRQTSFIHTFQLAAWIQLANLFEKNAIRRYSSKASLLYLLAESNAYNLIKCHPSRLSGFEVEEERYGPPILAALATGSHEAACELLKAQVEIQPSTSPLHGLYKQYRSNDRKRSSIGRDFKFRRGQHLLLYLAGEVDEFVLQVFLSLGTSTIDIECQDSSGLTPLMHAAKRELEPTVRLLLEIGANSSATCRSHETPLFLAANRDYLAIVQLLLDYGASATELDAYGRTLLSRNAEKGRLNIVQLLLDRGASVTKTDANGWTPLSRAAAQGHLAVVQLLVNHGASVTETDNEGWTPLLGAIQGVQDRANSLLGYGSDFQRTDESDPTVLSMILPRLFSESIAMIQFLLDQGTCIEAANNSGRTLLSWAASSRYDTQGVITQLLLDRGAKIEAADKNGQTPLSWAVATKYYYNTAIIDLLLDSGANIESADDDGRTPLSWAASNYNDIDGTLLRVLIDWGAKIDAPDRNGRKPLSWAVSARKTLDSFSLKLLLDKSADIEAPDKSGRTLLSWAVSNRLEEGTIIKLLLNNGANIEAADKDGRTPLSWASSESFDDKGHTVALLLDRGANIEAVDKSGRTPLLWAIEGRHIFGKPANVKALLDNGANFEAADKDGRTPLSWVAANPFNYSYKQIQQLLLNHGADIKAVDKKGLTPLDYFEQKKKTRGLL